MCCPCGDLSKPIVQVELHEVEIGLERVGAMQEVKDVLLETMLWPSK